MAKRKTQYKIIMTFPDGEVIDSREEDDDEGVFDTIEEAEEYFLEWMNNYRVGGEVLHLSNPGDYPLEVVEQEPEYEIHEI